MPNYKIGIELEADDNASGNLKKVSSAAGSLDDAMTTGGKGVAGMGGALAGLVSPAGLALGAVTAIGGAMVVTGAHAMDLAGQVETSAALMQSQLALTDEQAVAFEGTMRELYAANYGESYEDIADTLVAVEQGFARIGGLAPGEMQAVTESAFAMRDAFGYDVNETVNATATLMEQFGLTSSEAMDMLTAATQRGLNSSDDLLDTIGEYGPQFGQGGASAEEFFGILEAGQQGAVLGNDKAADAFKEFSIRIKDDSTLTKTALSDIGVSYDTLKQGFANGSVTTVEAMQTVIEKINEIEDPIERNVAGVALFGTQWEDLGEAGVLALGDIDAKMEDVSGATESLNEQYDTTAADLAAATRVWDDALVEVGGELNLLAVQALPLLAQGVTDYIVPAINELTEFLRLLKEGKGITWDWGWLDGPGGPAVPPPSEPVTVPQAQAMAGASMAGGSQIYQQFYIERGDFETVQEAAQVGIGQAQRVRGS